jgi:hypothetical protein
VTTGTLHDAVMRWSNQLLACVSLQAFADAVGILPMSATRV